MTVVSDLAKFAVSARFDDLPASAVESLKIRILDSLGCAIGALNDPPILALRKYVDEVGGEPRSTMIGGIRTAPDRAALYNSALVRELDFNDAYMAPQEACHPSDNLAAVLAMAQDAGSTGQDLLVGLAVAYQVQSRLCDVAPVRHKGFDHTTHLPYSAAAGASRAARLDQEGAANAIAIAGTHLNALRVTRTGRLSHWKGMAAPAAVAGAVNSLLLARNGITGPPEVFEGNKGFQDAIAGDFSIDWSREDLAAVNRTILKKYNAEIHSQSSIDLVLDLKRRHSIDPSLVERIEVEIFDVAYHIIGGGEEGDKTLVDVKEEADHSLQYILAVALLDDMVTPAQYNDSRIRADDVQLLLRKVHVAPVDDLSGRYPAEHPCRLRVVLTDGRWFEGAANEYEGFQTKPAGWPMIRSKFDQLAEEHLNKGQRDKIAAIIQDLEAHDVHELTAALAGPFNDI